MPLSNGSHGGVFGLVFLCLFGSPSAGVSSAAHWRQGLKSHKKVTDLGELVLRWFETGGASALSHWKPIRAFLGGFKRS